MNSIHRELLDRYLAGQTSEEESAAFELCLKNDAELRTLYLDHLNLETALEAQAGAVYELLDFPAVTPAQTSRRPWIQPRQLMSAAAGLIVGLFSASMVFGYVLPMTSKVIPLLNDGFEGGSSPLVSGMPVKPGVWSGDFTEVVSTQQGVTPAGGKKMLRFLRADYTGKPAKLSYSGDLYRLIDLRSQAADLRDGKALVTVAAHFRTIPCARQKPFQCGLGIYALNSLPEETPSTTQRNSATLIGGGSDWSLGRNLAASARQFTLDSNGADWQKFRIELRVPAGTQYLMIAFHLLDQTVAGGDSPDSVAEYPGQFMDNVEVALIRNVPLQ